MSKYVVLYIQNFFNSSTLTEKSVNRLLVALYKTNGNITIHQINKKWKRFHQYNKSKFYKDNDIYYLKKDIIYNLKLMIVGFFHSEIIKNETINIKEQRYLTQSSDCKLKK